MSIFLSCTLFAQDSLQVDTTNIMPPDTNKASAMPFDTVTIIYGDDDLNAPIEYSAEDSIVYDVSNNKAYLYSKSTMKYDDMNLQSELVEFDWTTYTLTAEGRADSTGIKQGTPVFTQGGKDYESNKMQYNFKTKKGRIFDVITQEDEAYIASEVVLKNQYDEWYGLRTHYTTCNNKAHPHFALKAKRSKVIPGKLMVTGPVNLVVADVPTPLYLPFGIFPTKQGRRSGIIFPELNYNYTVNGYGIKNGGYYFAINNNINAQITADAHTNGLFGVRAGIEYKKRYKVNGRFNFNYFRTPPSNPDAVGATPSHDMDFNWVLNLEPQARPNNSLNINIDAQTPTFNRNSLETSNRLLEAQVSSRINYVRRFPGKPYSLTIAARHDQNLNTNAISFVLPELGFNVSRFSPFKRKVSAGQRKWYENIGFTYSARAKAQVNTIDSVLFTQQTLDKMLLGMQQNISVDAPFNLFKYIKVNPSFRYRETWSLKSLNKRYDPDTAYVPRNDTIIDTVVSFIQTDTLFGFKSAREFNLGVSLSTVVYGTILFKKKNGLIKGIRHILTPTVAYAFRPDFSEDRWKMYQQYVNGETGETVLYDPLRGISPYGGAPPSGMSNNIRFQLNNNVEIKVRQNKGDTATEYKNVNLFRYNLDWGYDFTADSIKMSNLNMSFNTNFSRFINFSFNSSFSPYVFNEKNQRTGKTLLSENRGILKMRSASLAINGSFSPKGKQNPQQRILNSQAGTINEREFVYLNYRQFYDFDIPWSVNVGYNLSLNRGANENPDSLIISSNSLSFGGDVNITRNWKAVVSSGFDIINKEVTYTRVKVVRDLHCWQLAFDWVAYPLERQNFNIELRVKSAILQDLKLTRKSPPNFNNNNNF